jgi:hypothetical protein
VPLPKDDTEMGKKQIFGGDLKKSGNLCCGLRLKKDCFKSMKSMKSVKREGDRRDRRE